MKDEVEGETVGFQFVCREGSSIACDSKQSRLTESTEKLHIVQYPNLLVKTKIVFQIVSFPLSCTEIDAFHHHDRQVVVVARRGNRAERSCRVQVCGIVHVRVFVSAFGANSFGTSTFGTSTFFFRSASRKGNDYAWSNTTDC